MIGPARTTGDRDRLEEGGPSPALVVAVGGHLDAARVPDPNVTIENPEFDPGSAVTAPFAVGAAEEAIQGVRIDELVDRRVQFARIDLFHFRDKGDDGFRDLPVARGSDDRL
jgi:hypothetical protein